MRCGRRGASLVAQLVLPSQLHLGGRGQDSTEWGATLPPDPQQQSKRSPTFQTPVPFSLPSPLPPLWVFSTIEHPPLLSGKLGLKVPQGLGVLAVSPGCCSSQDLRTPPPSILDRGL